MNPSLAVKIIDSCEAMERSALVIAERMAPDPSALSKGIQREVTRLSHGIGEVRRAIQTEVSMMMTGAVEVSTSEALALDRLGGLLSSDLSSIRAKSWGELGEQLAAEGFSDDSLRSFKKERLIQLAIAAAGNKRYAHGSPSRNSDGRLFDLLNLPAEVGGQGGLGPIVRACYDGSVKYGQVWRFATPLDCATSKVADDSDDEEET